MPTNEEIREKFLALLTERLTESGYTSEQIDRAGFGLNITDNKGDRFIGATVQGIDKGLPEMKIGFWVRDDGSVVPDKYIEKGDPDARDRGLNTFFTTLLETMEAYYGKPGAVR